MELSSLQILAIFIVSAVAGMGSVLDELQTHRPLIACTFTGLILGDITTGIIIGGTLEMIALGWMNIGAAMAPDAALASVISTILVIAGHQTIGAGIAIAMPLAAAGQVLTILCRTLTVVFQHQADHFAEKGELRGIDICHLGALLIQALRVAVPSTLVAMYIGTGAVEAMLAAIPPVITGGLHRRRRLCNGHQHDGREIPHAVLLPWFCHCSIHDVQPRSTRRYRSCLRYRLYPAQPEIRSACRSTGFVILFVGCR